MCFVLTNAHGHDVQGGLRAPAGCHTLCWEPERHTRRAWLRSAEQASRPRATPRRLSGTVSGTGCSLLGAAGDALMNAATDYHERSGFAKGGTRNT